MTGVLSAATLTRADVEDFLYHEAALLDEWRLEEWLDLFTIDCVYEVPAPDRPDDDPAETFALIHDRRPMLEQRVIRLTKPTAHAEFPHRRAALRGGGTADSNAGSRAGRRPRTGSAT
ncbi:aromatic-ring-hydroxylating dioxygenase subunit beta [Mycobacterium sp.]|uniref:aromatic-ring-hydroxylating dioxygenase subunit beta n=1 Tax=Mycobacterium sp. TaxID=1785 RepID=UPI003D0A0585